MKLKGFGIALLSLNNLPYKQSISFGYFFLHVKHKGRWDEVKSLRNTEMVAGGNKRNESILAYLNNALGKNKQIVL